MIEDRVQLEKHLSGQGRQHVNADSGAPSCVDGNLLLLFLWSIMLRRTLRENSGFQKIKGHDPLVMSGPETESIHAACLLLLVEIYRNPKHSPFSHF